MEINKWMGLTFLSIFLTGCIPAVFVAGGAAGAALSSDNRNLQTISDDTDTTHQANNLIQNDEALSKEAHITVTLFNGNALITGQAPNTDLQQRPEQLIKSLKKIHKIFNQVKIAEPIGAFTRSNDALITTNVKTRMLTTTDLKSSQFKIITEDGTVYIMGLATKEQARMAVNVASQSTGVKQVVKLIEYVS
ncbi:MAG: hypothetical protein LEGION0398_MBIBDBAK_00009 [Legionellaceae bacterium]